jgi:hypothetical protein
MQKLVVGFSLLIVHKHFHEYVTRAHGDPETLSAWQPPRTSREDRSAPAA